MKLKNNKILINEYKAITFYSYFELFLCLMPISDIITDVWTIYLYIKWNKTMFAAIACFLLFASFRFQTILWLLLKKKNARFFAHYKLYTFIWMIPMLSLFVNCKHYKLTFSNEFCLFLNLQSILFKHLFC